MLENLKITEVDCQTGEVVERLLTEQELEHHMRMIEQFNDAQQKKIEEEAQKNALKESAAAKLSALGLTEEEIQAIIG